MYNFIDVNEASVGVVLPSEALQINGLYIENLIPGYRTLNVSGREALSPDIETYATGIRDGSEIRSRRYPERIITVRYQLIAETNEAFREAYNRLARILDVKDAELIFNDEQDKFFVGTPCTIGSVEPGRNSVIGEFEILCVDPFKYSVLEYEAEPFFGQTNDTLGGNQGSATAPTLPGGQDSGSVLLDYHGTYKCFPTLVAEFFNEDEASEDGETELALTGSGDCGYVAFFNEDEKIIQLGDPEEADGENAYEKSQTLVNSTFKKSTAWGSATKKQWAVNNGVTSSSAVEQAGNVAMGVASYAVQEIPDKQELLRKTSTATSFHINYIVVAKERKRTENSVRLEVAVMTSLERSTSYFGYGLIGSLYIGGSWHDVTIKNDSVTWRGNSAHTVGFYVDVNGLSTTTSKLTGIKFKVRRMDTISAGGTLPETACSDLVITKYVSDEPETYYLTASDFGSGSNWHGPSITRTIPADKAGEVGATNFKLTYSQKMSIGNDKNATSQLGAFQVLLTDANGKIVCGVNVYKGSSGKKAKLRFYVNSSVAETIDVDLSYNNKYFQSSKTSTITKTASGVTFDICGIKKSYGFSSTGAMSSMSVRKITFTFTKFGSKTPLSYNGLYWAKFVKDNCETWKDVPNKFSANDIVEADCKSGEIYLNGVLAPSLGALGNDWEEFCLKPGLNHIGFSYSDWVEDDYAPKVKVRYREVFL